MGFIASGCCLGAPYSEHPESEYAISIILSFPIPEARKRKTLKKK